MSKKVSRNYYKCKIYCKELNRTFKSIREAENYFMRNGLSEALNKGIAWHGLHFKRV